MTTPKTVPEILRAAADLIEPEGRWTQGTFARDRYGRGTLIGSPDAVCWCAAGAVYRAAERSTGMERAIELLAETTAPHIAHWNDAPERTQAEVCAALRAAADRVEGVGNG